MELKDTRPTLVMACATVMEEMLPLIPASMDHKVFDFGLHTKPEHLRRVLQAEIDSINGRFGTIILGYGLCSQALVGLRANGCQLVAPRVDDCIALFLGSRTAYSTQFNQEPGTYFLTKGWIEVGDTPFSDFDRNLKKYGPEKAAYIYQVMMGRYKRLAFINTGRSDLEKYRKITQQIAERFELNYEDLDGSDLLVRKLLLGPWDDEIIVIEPGNTFTLEQFIPAIRADSGKKNQSAG